MSDYLAKSIHTGRELELMLAGKKPLAVFYAEISELPDEAFIPEDSFAPYVQGGLFVRSEIVEVEGFVEKLGRRAEIKYVFFARASEAWRIEAMLIVRKSFKNAKWRWNEALERIEGTLLGYTEEENDEWCKCSELLMHLRASAGEIDGAQPVYAADGPASAALPLQPGRS